jgi:predicted DCC family thiol-disulfide oxidoreductase YuxK
LSERPVLLYDRDCGFCRWSLGPVLRWDRARRLRLVALQSPEAEQLLPGMSQDRRFASAHLVLPNGEVHSGGDALAPLLRLLPRGAPLAVGAEALVPVSRRVYDWIARHRVLLGRPITGRAKARATARIDGHG